MKIGDIVKTPRFLSIHICEIFDSRKEAWDAGYTEPTHYNDPDWDVFGRPIDIYHMVFAAVKKNKPEL